MKKALILGTNAGQADIIEYLQDSNWEVHSCGYKKEGPGVELANFFHLVNTVDIEAVAELAKRLEVDIVYSVSSDTNIRTATKVSEMLNLPVLLGSEIIDLFHHKDRFRKFLNDNSINTVKYINVKLLDDLKGWGIFPCVVKPTDSQGQRGVKKVDNKSELEKAVVFALSQSKSQTAIVEEFLSGVEISTNMIVQNGKIIVNEFTERLVFDTGFFGLPKGHSIPMRDVKSNVLQEAVELTEHLIAKLAIENAVLYIQMKVTENGPKIIEVAPRLDGCHIWRLLKTAKGYDLRKLTIDVLTGNRIKENIDTEISKSNYTLAFHHLKTGSTFDLSALNVPAEEVFNEYRYSEGEEVQPINGSLEVVGYYIKKD
ncbi:MAG: ATP-grasp domain-containing protein [Bacteroidota bacterium]|nr:ATP-grasp domain-containing protein [Bacteroidota bacterium]